MKPNGFTLVESLLCLLIMAVLCAAALPLSRSSASLAVFMKSMQEKVQSSQLQAFIHKEPVVLTFYQNGLEDGQAYWSYPGDIACTFGSYAFNEKGNISRAGSITCHNSRETMKMVLQLGTGSSRIERLP